MSEEYVGYVPVPMWNGNEWVPVDLSRGRDAGLGSYAGYPLMRWPAGLDPMTIPRPSHGLYETVRFNWSDKIARGKIMRITRCGGAYRAHEAGRSEAVIAGERYAKPAHYDIEWLGHIRWVNEFDIIKD